MSQAAITVGSKVRVTRVRDRIPADLVTALQGRFNHVCFSPIRRST